MVPQVTWQILGTGGIQTRLSWIESKGTTKASDEECSGLDYNSQNPPSSSVSKTTPLPQTDLCVSIRRSSRDEERDFLTHEVTGGGCLIVKKALCACSREPSPRYTDQEGALLMGLELGAELRTG